MDALLATGAALLLGSVACVRLLLDLLAPHLPKHSSPQVHAGSSPSVSTGRAMRRWLVSLLLGALSAGWLALLSEALVLSLARDSLPLVVLVSALRLLGSALFVSAVTSLAVYWATLHNSITGPPFYSVLRYWVAANAVLFAALLLAVLYACVRRSDQEAHLLLACAYLLSFLGLAYYSALVVRVLPRVPSSSRRIMCRLAPLIAVSCSSCAAGSAYYFYRSFESSECMDDLMMTSECAGSALLWDSVWFTVLQVLPGLAIHLVLRYKGDHASPPRPRTSSRMTETSQLLDHREREPV